MNMEIKKKGSFIQVNYVFLWNYNIESAGDMILEIDSFFPSTTCRERERESPV